MRSRAVFDCHVTLLLFFPSFFMSTFIIQIVCGVCVLKLLFPPPSFLFSLSSPLLKVYLSSVLASSSSSSFTRERTNVASSFSRLFLSFFCLSFSLSHSFSLCLLSTQTFVANSRGVSSFRLHSLSLFDGLGVRLKAARTHIHTLLHQASKQLLAL